MWRRPGSADSGGDQLTARLDAGRQITIHVLLPATTDAGIPRPALERERNFRVEQLAELTAYLASLGQQRR